MKYKVILGWRYEYIFDDLYEAAAFAKSAAGHRIEHEDRVRIELISEKELEDGEDDE